MRLNSFILVALCFLGQTILALAGNGNSLASYLDREDSRLHRFVLPNGLIGLVKEDHSAPVAAVQIWIRTGSIHEGKDLGAGLSHYLEHMVFKGTPTRGPADITRSITDAGGKINAYTTLDRTVFHTVLPSANWRTAVEILGDGVMNATFPEEEWEREKQVVVREMDMGKDDPGRRLYKLLSRTAYQVHPYRFPVIGYEDIFSKVTREDLVDYHHRRYLPDNMIVMVAGDVDHREVEDYVQTTFKDFQRRAAEPVIIPTEPPQMAPRFGRETGNFNISRMQCAFHTVPLSHEDTAALDVLASVVGHGRSSRLNRVLKEEAQLVHSINAWNYSPKLAGIFGVTADFDPENETALLDALYREIESWHSETFTEEEVQKARRQVLVGELSSLTTMEGQAENYASGEFFAGDPTYARQYIARIEAVEPEDLNRVARKYFTVNNRTTVILSPEQEEAAAAMDASTLDKPTVEKVLLSNGTPLIVREDRRLPFVHISIAMHGGLLVEY